MAKQTYTFSTAGQRIEEHRKRVGDDADTNIEFMGEESLIDAINTFERQIVNAPFSGMEIDRERKITVPGNGRGWDFMEDDFPLAFVQKGTIEDDIAKGYTGALEVSNPDDYEDESGAAVIYDRYGTWDFIRYTGFTTPNLTGVTDVTMAHASGEEIVKLSKLPTDFARAKKLKIGRNEWYEGSEDPDDGFFSVYNGFLWLPSTLGITSGILTYFKQRTAITDVENTLNIPDILDPVLDNLLDARAFSLGGDSEQLVSDALFRAADALRGAMGYTVATSNKRIKLARRPPRSPTWIPGGRYRASSFDEGNYDL